MKFIDCSFFLAWNAQRTNWGSSCDGCQNSACNMLTVPKRLLQFSLKYRTLPRQTHWFFGKKLPPSAQFHWSTEKWPFLRATSHRQLALPTSFLTPLSLFSCSRGQSYSCPASYPRLFSLVLVAVAKAIDGIRCDSLSGISSRATVAQTKKMIG